MVFWDQRGTGKSYYPTARIGHTMSVERMLDDTSEVIGYLRKRFNRDKIFFAGHSWGSILGINEWHQKTDPYQYPLLMLSVLLRSHTISFSEIYRDLFSNNKSSSLPSFKKGILQTDIPAQVGYRLYSTLFYFENLHWQYHNSCDILRNLLTCFSFLTAAGPTR